MPRRELHVAHDRFVLTYEVDGVPVGVVTGEVFAERAHLEHIILFPEQPAMYLTQMLAAAFQHALEIGLYIVTFVIDPKQPKAKALQRLAARHGFEQETATLWRITLDENAPARSGSGRSVVPPMPPYLADEEQRMVRECELARHTLARKSNRLVFVHPVAPAVD